MKLFIITLILFSIFLFGCASTEPMIQSVDQFGGANRNTIKITKDEKANDFTVRFSLSKNRDKSADALVKGHSDVNEYGIYEVEPVENEPYHIEKAGVNEYKFEGNNFHWVLPEFQTNIEIEYNVSSNMSLYGGTSFCSSGDYDLFGYNFGIGLFREDKNWALRFDIAGALNDMVAEANYIRVENIQLKENNTRKVYFFEEESREKFLNLNLGLTINTRNPEWFVNGFANYTIGWQNFYDIETKPVYSGDFLHDDDLTYEDSYHSLSIGVYKDIETLGKLIAGARFTKYTDLKGRLFIPDYFIQFDFDLF